MDVAVLIAGISVYLVATLIYLRSAYRVAPLWCWSSIVLPPLALAYYFIYWRRAWPLFVLQTVGLVLLVLGVVFFVRANAGQMTNPIMLALQQVVAPASLTNPVDASVEQFAASKDVRRFIGRIDGVIGGRVKRKPVLIQEVELKDGVLRFKDGVGLFPQNEVAVFLGITEHEINERWQLEVNPTTDHPPLIHVSSFDPRTSKIKTDVYDGGYWLDLVLTDRRLNLVSGFVRLLLPGGKKDFIAGNFDGYTNQLRLIDGEVDRFYDSKDTVEYVAKLHIETRFKKAVSAVTFMDTHLLAHMAHPTAKTFADLTLADNSVHSISLDLFKGQQGWTVDADSTDDLHSVVSQLVLEPEEEPELVVIQELVFEGDDYEPLIGKKLVVTSKSGGSRGGVLKNIEQTQLVLHTEMEDGFMDVYIPKRKIEKIVIAP